MVFYTAPENLVLHAASNGRRPQLFRKLERIALEAGHQFWRPGAPIPYALFPLRGIVSLEMSAHGKREGIALVGRDGFAGVSLFLGSERAETGAVAFTAGEALVTLVPISMPARLP